MKTFPPHQGSDWRYKKGCRCDQCRKEHAKYEGKAKVLREKEQAGILIKEQRLVEILQVREHIRFLKANNIGMRSISHATGISPYVIHEMGWGGRKLCLKKNADKILGLGIKSEYKHQLVNSARARELIEEMKATGLKKYEIGSMLGYKNGQFIIYKTMRIENYNKIVALHSKICSQRATTS